MNRTFLALAAICTIGVGGMALARHDEAAELSPLIGLMASSWSMSRVIKCELASSMTPIPTGFRCEKVLSRFSVGTAT